MKKINLEMNILKVAMAIKLKTNFVPSVTGRRKLIIILVKIEFRNQSKETKWLLCSRHINAAKQH